MTQSSIKLSTYQLNGIIHTAVCNLPSWYNLFLRIREQSLYKVSDLSIKFYLKYFKVEEYSWEIDLEKLETFPAGSLAKEWANFYTNKSFSLTPKYEKHDIAHVILGYSTSIIEEVRMCAFRIGAGKITVPEIAYLLIGLAVFPEFAQLFYRDFKLGKSALNFFKWDFRHLLNEPLEDLRALIFSKSSKRFQ